MNRPTRIAIAAVLLCAALAAAYLWWQAQETPPPAASPAVPAAAPAMPAPPPAQPAPPPEPAIQHPLESGPQTPPLPGLDESDKPLGRALVALLGEKPWRTLFFPERIVRRIVATVDNLPRHDAPVAMWPVRTAGSPFLASGSDASLAIDPANARRYAPYVRLAEAVDAARLVALYRRFYPLFQQAYVELGFPQGYFNDRLVAALDDLLATPEPAEPLQLTQPKVLYQFSDPDLEQRSAGQRIMLRIGVANARAVKAKLREIRQLVAQR